MAQDQDCRDKDTGTEASHRVVFGLASKICYDLQVLNLRREFSGQLAYAYRLCNPHCDSPLIRSAD